MTGCHYIRLSVYHPCSPIKRDIVPTQVCTGLLSEQRPCCKNTTSIAKDAQNAPKEIVQNDKKLLKELNIDDSKLRSIVSSIN